MSAGVECPRHFVSCFVGIHVSLRRLEHDRHAHMITVHTQSNDKNSERPRLPLRYSQMKQTYFSCIPT